ncbi:MAG: tetratricopeptide repeat protein [Spirochaetales bacterium]|nr:tetratricopeptide repeat protein [Spirochaetales bacterium]
MDEKRQLSAIMFSDIVGYSKMMSLNESRTIRLLTEHDRILSQAIAQGHGRLLKKMGDGVLAAFESAADAVSAALVVQRTISERNLVQPAEEHFQVRIGIHIGDVLLRGDDIFGDGVNIAARIEPLAEPGGICISQTVYDMVKARPEIQTTLLGARELKNIKDKVNIYKVLIQAEEATAPQLAPPPKRERPYFLIAIMVSLFIALPLLAILVYNVSGSEDTAATEQKTLQVLIAPFHGLDEAESKSGKLVQLRLEEALAAHIGRAQGVQISTPTVTAPRTAEEARRLGQESAAQFVIWGLVQKTGDVLEIRPRIEFLRRPGFRVGSMYGKDTMQIAPLRLPADLPDAHQLGSLALHVASAYFYRYDPEKALQLNLAIEPADAAVLEMRTYLLWNNGREEQAAQTIEEALKRFPGELHVALAGADFYYETGRSKDRARALLKQAQNLDPNSIRVNDYWCYFLITEGQAEQALPFCARVGELEPNNALGPQALSRYYVATGNYAQAIEAADRAFTQDPEGSYRDLRQAYSAAGRYEELADKLTALLEKDVDRADILQHLGYAQTESGDTDSARKSYERALALNPRASTVWMLLGQLDLRTGNFSEARRKFEEYSKLRPLQGTGDGYVGWTYYLEGEYARALEEIRKARVREPAYPDWIFYEYLATWRKDGRDVADRILRDPNNTVPVREDPELGYLAGRIDEAVYRAERLKGSPTAIRVWEAVLEYTMGIRALRDGEKEAATAHFQKAIAAGKVGDWGRIMAEVEISRIK